MKKFIPVLVVLFVVPFFVSAHTGSASFNQITTPHEMMFYIEDQALGDEIHEEMESLMEKMMEGSLSQEEAEQLLILMEENPVPNSIMMNRLGMTNNFGSPYGHMFGGRYNFSGWLFTLTVIIWFFVGLFTLSWFMKKPKSQKEEG
jgi:hypothetical protein